jgi:hypothetical protein
VTFASNEGGVLSKIQVSFVRGSGRQFACQVTQAGMKAKPATTKGGEDEERLDASGYDYEDEDEDDNENDDDADGEHPNADDNDNYENITKYLIRTVLDDQESIIVKQTPVFIQKVGSILFHDKNGTSGGGGGGGDTVPFDERVRRTAILTKSISRLKGIQRNMDNNVLDWLRASGLPYVRVNAPADAAGSLQSSVDEAQDVSATRSSKKNATIRQQQHPHSQRPRF